MGTMVPLDTPEQCTCVVFEGELTLHANGESLTAGPFDSIWLPKGTSLVYEAKNASIVYAIHPANWANHEN